MPSPYRHLSPLPRLLEKNASSAGTAKMRA
jgi:hypothetical protein